ncbi:type II secretion system protein GspM [Rheinheimera muenzenbergensis]|uniref:Type II secretion system protein GspM n=1 Tax=Rheinheimera muenzenbergensis TaxID=1193628 RepID=A0ABU8CBK9_9GAMM
MNQWQQLSERFSQLQPREKGLIAAAVLFLTLWLALNYLLEPSWQATKKQQLQQRQLQQQLADVQQQTVQFKAQLGIDQDAGYRQQIADLQQQQQQLNAQIRQSASHFIGAEQMLSLLQNMLASSEGVQIKRLASAPAEAVKLEGQTAEDAALLYQHKLTLVMTGSYARLYQVLTRMEQLPWLINWAGLQYQVEQYPEGELSLELITVSEHEDIIRL